MPARNNYPRTVAEVIRPSKYKRATKAAVRAFARSKPWKGDRVAKFRAVHAELCRVYGIEARLVFNPLVPACYSPSTRTINLPHPSVVSYLHEFAHAVFGSCEVKACRWSINLFRIFFPRSFASCQQQGHMLVRGA